MPDEPTDTNDTQEDLTDEQLEDVAGGFHTQNKTPGC